MDFTYFIDNNGKSKILRGIEWKRWETMPVIMSPFSGSTKIVEGFDTYKIKQKLKSRACFVMVHSEFGEASIGISISVKPQELGSGVECVLMQDVITKSQREGKDKKESIALFIVPNAGKFKFHRVKNSDKRQSYTLWTEILFQHYTLKDDVTDYDNLLLF